MDIMSLGGAIVYFTLLFIFISDIGLFLLRRMTISEFMVKYLGGQKYYYRIFMFGFLVGGLIVHFSRFFPVNHGG